MSDRIVVLRALGLGDLLTAVPALRGLRRAWPTQRITLAVPGPLAPLARLTGAVDDCVDHRGPGPLPAGLAAPEVAVNLHGRGPKSHRSLLELRPGRLIAFANPDLPATAGLPRWVEAEHEVRRWCRLLWECGIPADPGDLDLRIQSDLVLHLGRPTVIHPGAKSPARRWPAERWSAVAKAEASRRPVLITAGPGEAELAHRVAAGACLDADCIRATDDVTELVAVVAAAGRLLSGDTGVAHLATALGVPSLILFGPTPPATWGPPPDRPQHRVIWSGRTSDPWGQDTDPGLNSITVARVLEALENWPVNC